MPRDFLSGLIGRAFEQVPVLEKRRASMFEPERGYSGRESAWSESVEEAPASDRERPAAPRRYDRDVETRPRSTRTAEPPPAEEWPRHRPAETQPRAVTAFQPADDPKPNAAEAGRTSIFPAAAGPSPVRVERLIEREVETRQTVVEHREPRIERTRSATPAEESSPWPPPRREVIAIRPETSEAHGQGRSRSDALPSRIEAPRKASPPSPPAARTPLRARPAPVSPAPLPAPAIQVTIGRVELRSPQPAPLPKPGAQRARAPKLGLDDYLRRREGGLP